MTSLHRRLWDKVDERESEFCWPWKGSADSRGYGRIFWKRGRAPKLAHRVMFEHIHCYAPPVVMHTCDNPSCCNPEHLRGGTQKDNLRDMAAKGRQWKQKRKRDASHH